MADDVTYAYDVTYVYDEGSSATRRRCSCFLHVFVLCTSVRAEVFSALEERTHSLEKGTHSLEKETHSLKKGTHSLEEGTHSLEKGTHSLENASLLTYLTYVQRKGCEKREHIL